MKETNITPQQLWRTAITENKHDGEALDATEEEWPPPTWRAQFKAQANADMMDDVVGYVGKRAVWIEHRQGRRAPGLVREMIQDALGDTFAGIVKWDPARCSLALHLKTVVCSRLSHEFDRAEQFQHINVADAPECDVHDALAGDAKPVDLELDQYVDQFEKRLRLLADGDEAVLALLDVYLEGITERGKVCRATGLTKAAYHNAHRRLKRLAENLPEHMRAAALATIS
jgi:hypothetical protein